MKLLPTINLVLILLIALTIASAIYMFSYKKEVSQAAPVNVSVPATPAPELKKTPRKQARVNVPVQSYGGEAALKNGLKLPEQAIANPRVEVLAASKIKADDHPHTVTTTLDIDTGEVITYDKRDPLPWLAFNQRTEAGIYAGIKNGEPTARLQVQHDLFQVKSLHFGGIATVDQPFSGPIGTDYFVGAGVWASW